MEGSPQATNEAAWPLTDEATASPAQETSNAPTLARSFPAPPGEKRRHTFDVRRDQLWALDDIQRALWRGTGCKPTLSALVQEALDRYIAEQRRRLDALGQTDYGGQL